MHWFMLAVQLNGRKRLDMLVIELPVMPSGVFPDLVFIDVHPFLIPLVQGERGVQILPGDIFLKFSLEFFLSKRRSAA